MDMDDTKTKVAERLKQYKKRHSDMHSRFTNNIPSLQAKDWQQNHQLVQRLRTQTPKSKTQKQYDMHKQLVNVTSEQQNKNDILQASPQKRPYDNFNGVTSVGEDQLSSKLSRLSDMQKQFSNVQKNNASFEMTPNVQPNVNPFQMNKEFMSKDSSNLCPATAVSKTDLMGNVSTHDLSNSILNSISESTPDISNIDSLVDNLNKTDPEVKIESSVPSPCSVRSQCQSLTTQTKLENTSGEDNFNQFTSDPLSSLGDLDSIESYALFGEITGNTQKNVKVENRPISEGDSKGSEPLTKEKKKGSKKWNSSSKDQKTTPTSISVMNPSEISCTSNPLANLNQMASMQNEPSSRQNVNITNQQQQNSLLIKQNSKHQINQQINQNIQQLVPSTQQQQMNSNQQINQSNRTINLDHIDTPVMNTSPINQQNLKNLMASKGSVMNCNVSSPLDMMQSPKNPLQSPNSNLPSNLSNHTLSSSLTPSSSQTIVPPSLPRHPNMRQHLANHINKQQQPMMPNMPSMNNPYMPSHSVTTTTERLQELLKRKQFRMIEMQHQMSKNQLMNQHLMSPVQNPMPQANQFQFGSNFQNYNQQKATYQQMNMQAQQSPGMGFYPPPYMDSSGNTQMFPSGAPPGYNQQNRAGTMLRNILRDRQHHMVEMYSPSMANRQNMEQQGIFNPPTKAPPQYTSQDMNPAQMDPQQMMMPSNPSMQSQSRLTHFSQPETNTMGMAGHNGMNSVQVRLRSPMSAINRYPPPPSLSRPLNMPGNEAMNSVNTNQFGNYGSTHMTSPMAGMTQNNPNFNHNMTSEQLVYLNKKRQMEQHRQQQLLMQQRQQQHQHQQQQQNAMQQTQNFSPLLGNNIVNNKNANPVNMLDDSLGYNATNQTFQQRQPSSQIGNIPCNLVTDSTPLSRAGSEKNAFVDGTTETPTLSSNSNKKVDNITPLPPPAPSANDSLEDTDLDKILNNPPDTFDLVEMFST